LKQWSAGWRLRTSDTHGGYRNPPYKKPAWRVWKPALLENDTLAGGDLPAHFEGVAELEAELLGGAAVDD
jgi:hypothetical protein